MTITRFFPVFVSILIFALPARAGGQTAYYDVYASGFKAVTAKVVMNTQKGRYDVSLSAKTQGFLGKMAPWQGSFETQGWILKDRFQPETHTSTAVWKGEEEIKEYSYTKSGAFKKLTTTEFGKKPVTEIPDTELTSHTIDTLTATLNVFENVAAGGSCEGSADVFDGKRRFTQIFSPQPAETLKRSKYNIYEGPAERCTIEVVPGAGDWHEKPRGWMSIQEQGRDRGTMPTIWTAVMSRDGPAIPVKIMVKTAYGTLFMHLVDYKKAPS
ncbi:MAG: DUF3108 domain-containing protein [Alphaproteobacteria bacterium]